MVVKLRKYVPDGEVLNGFFRDRGQKTVIQGPIGSGTSTACCFRIYKTALEQEPDRDGVRPTRWLIVRNTFNQLQETTIKTWLEWFPEANFGELRRTRPMMHHIRRPLRDGTTLDMEVIFLALDQEDDIAKLASLEVTGVFFNEVQFINDKPLVDEAFSRTGRYPAMKRVKATWRGVFCDMNAPQEGHWVPYLRGDVPLPQTWNDDQRKEYTNAVDPETGQMNWTFFMQPPALIEVFKDGKVVDYTVNPKAENQKWLLPGYYREQYQNKPKSWIDERLMNRVGLYTSGRPVYPQFVREAHILAEDVDANPAYPLIVGLDFGRQPAAIVCQDINGRWFFLSEVIGENMGATTFAPMVRRHLFEHYPEFVTTEMKAGKEVVTGVAFWGDPAAMKPTETDERTAFQIFGTHGMRVLPAPGNNAQEVRKGAVNTVLTRSSDGRQCFNVNPQCITFKTGMNGGYHYAKVQGSAGNYHDNPSKNLYSHICEAAENAILGGGEGMSVITGGKPMVPVTLPSRRYKRRGRG